MNPVACVSFVSTSVGWGPAQMAHKGLQIVRRQLYEVLAAKGVAGRRLPVLLVANKADQGAKAHTPDFVRRRLEREL